MFEVNGKKIVIAVPSYKRPNNVDVLKYIPSARIYVSESEYPAYHSSYPDFDIKAVPDKFQGNLCRIRNKILDDEMADGNIVCIVDDDLSFIGYFENCISFKLLDEDEVYSFLAKYSLMAMDLGVHLWGINVNPDKQNYREYTPFSLSSYIGGPFMVHIDTDLRFDERLPLKEDYDFTLQNLNKYRKVLRVNKYFYNVKQMEQAGGCATYRNLEREKEQLSELQKKWGNKIVRSESLNSSRSHSTKKKRNFDVNPIIYPPIRGV